MVFFLLQVLCNCTELSDSLNALRIVNESKTSHRVRIFTLCLVCGSNNLCCIVNMHHRCLSVSANKKWLQLIPFDVLAGVIFSRGFANIGYVQFTCIVLRISLHWFAFVTLVITFIHIHAYNSTARDEKFFTCRLVPFNTRNCYLHHRDW